MPLYRHSTVLASGIPLGGIGTGSVEIRADGRFHDWEIFNNYLWSGAHADAPPEMWSEDAFFALRVKPAGGHPLVRLLYDDDKKSRAADSWYDHAIMYNFPFLRNIPGIAYSGRFPFARLEYEDAALPVTVALETFSPFIPFNAKDSALPLAFFVFSVENRGKVPCETSLMFSMRNCAGYARDKMTLRHDVRRDKGMTGVLMTADAVGESDHADRTDGTLMVAALDAQASCMPAWTDGRGLVGFENPASPALSQLFHPFRDHGVLAGGKRAWQRRVERQGEAHAGGAELHEKKQLGWRWRGAVCQKLMLKPDERRECVFMLAWHFPNHYHYFDTSKRLGHMYENWFRGAADVARYGARHFTRLREDSRRFCDQLYRGTLPAWFADSLNAQLTTFPQSFWWTKEGDVAAWEGSACCQIIPNINTHWSAFVPLLFFPDLSVAMKRRMAAFGRDASGSTFLALEQARRAASNQAQRGALGGWFAQRYRQLGYKEEDFLPRGSSRARKAFLYIGSATQLLLEHLWTGDADLLREVWPLVKENIEHGLSADTNGDGLQDGAISYLTYDHWFLPATNCYKGTMWLAELRAAARLAELMGDAAFAERCHATCLRGAKTFEKLFWNGDYYNLCRDALSGATDKGCLADQVSGHLYLRLCGLGAVHDEAHVRAALRAVHHHNRVPEHGLLNGVDLKPRSDWRYFARYSGRGDDEALAGQWVTPWTGTEYYVAATMIAEGLVREGLDVAKDVYDRHVAMGMLYNHIECGEHYFRALAAWAMLPALQGLVYDRAGAELTVAPKAAARAFDSVFILPGAWGRLQQTRTAAGLRVCIAVEAGELPVRAVSVQPWKLRPGETARTTCRLASDGQRTLPCVAMQGPRLLTVRLAAPLTLRAGACLLISIARQ